MSHKSVLPNEPIVPTASANPQSLSVEQAMAHASNLQANGQLARAENILRQILEKIPSHAPAMHLLGVVAHQAGKSDMAIELISRAIEVNPDIALFHSNLCEMYRQVQNFEKAVIHGEKAVFLNPGIASSHSNLGIVFYDKKDFSAAEVCQKKALDIDPGFARALNNLGSIMREYDRRDDAAGYYRRAMTADPEYLEPCNNLGSVLIEQEKFDEAIEVLAQTLSKNSGYADAHCNIGYALNGNNSFDQAFQHFQTALQLRPDYPEAHMGTALIYQEKQELPEALASCLRGVELNPEKPDFYCTLANIYMSLDEEDKGIENYNKALALKPDMPSALNGIGIFHMEAGDFKKAEDFFNQALIHTKPDDPSAMFHLTQVRKAVPDCTNMNALIRMMETADQLSENKQLILHYALGKCYDDIKDHDQAMQHFLAGARLKRKTVDFESASQAQVFDSVISTLDKPFIDRLSGSGVDSKLPIFILGMPRSGTTLTEQILASHPKIHGAGELRSLFNIAYRPVKTNETKQAFPFNLSRLTPDIVQEWGHAYIEQLEKRAPGMERITDKMPGNFLITGLIHLMMPNAKIIHVYRNPFDTCISTFNRLFRLGQEHSYDLTELGKYYKTYVNVMNHWQKVLPKGTFYNIRYEDIVANTEDQARKLLDYCGLPWDAACLDPSRNKRRIKTASVTQVREPIYTTSVERWRAYEDYLGALKDELGKNYRPW